VAARLVNALRGGRHAGAVTATAEALRPVLQERQRAWGRDIPTIVDFVTDPVLLGLAISPAQRTLLKAIYGLPLDKGEERDLWRRCTGREDYPARPFPEVTVAAGARAGKDSRIAAPMVCYEAVFGDHARHVTRGERGVIPLVAQDARAVKVAFGYVKDYLTRSPLLAPMVGAPPLAASITLTNRLAVECFPCTLRSLRGWSMPAAVLDELAFFRLEGQADSDVEVQASIRRGMVNFPFTRLIKISTPYMKSGVLFEDFRRGFGQPDPDLLVWRAPSVLMNPSLLEERLDRERRLDPQRFAREYEAEFAEDIDAAIPSAWIDQAIVKGRHELPPQAGVRYVAAVDPSGGGADAFTLSIVHVEGDANARRVVQDVIRGWGRGASGEIDLEGVVHEIAGICLAYGDTRTVHGDRYAAGWVRQRFRAEGVRYEEAALRDPEDPDREVYLDKSMAYLEAEPLFAQGRIEILDHTVQERELKLLERRPRAGGRTIVDHPDGGHDDHANALALAVAKAGQWRARPWAMTPSVPSHIAQIGEPTRSGGMGAVLGVRPGMAPAAGRAGGQADQVRRRY
jgi:hypothetical protein